jgi:phosphotriesterase-related protein
MDAGVPGGRIVIGHSCGSTDFQYHKGIIDGGSYLGFDRFGLENGMPDQVRVESIEKLLRFGCASNLIVSHDSVWYWGGSGPGKIKNWHPTNFFQRIAPILKERGVSNEQIEIMLKENPRHIFET